MNIQIYGKPKCFDSRKAQRFFKERKIRFQYVDLLQKGLSPGEFRNIGQAVGGWEALMDAESKNETAILIRYLADPLAKMEKLSENPQFIRTPIVRNGRQATIGYCPDIWKIWIQADGGS